VVVLCLFRTYRQRSETLRMDGRLMHKDIFGTVVGGDETVPLLDVEPLDSAGYYTGVRRRKGTAENDTERSRKRVLDRPNSAPDDVQRGTEPDGAGTDASADGGSE
jgi:hypothetical protein